MSRQAEPLDPRALSAWHEACNEEIHQGKEERGISCLLATHTGFRKRIVVHYTDRWRVNDGDREKFSLPSGCIACTIEDGGCRHCHDERYSCDDGFFMVKKNTKGVGREVPVWNNWFDYYEGESRPTELAKWLDHFFTTNDSFGFSVNHFPKVVKRVAERRHDIIANQHEGEAERWMGNSKRIVPDIKPHDLRATWATQCLRTGIDDSQVLDWAGWSSRTMLDRYRSELNDPSGENTNKYGQGRDGEGISAADKIAKLKELGLINDGENLSAGKLAELEEVLS
jgi:hypothetical protein